jgi:hypothetical protein
VTAKVIYGKPEPEWSMEEKVEWLVARVVPMREELTAVREGLDETKGKLAVMSGELRDYVSTAIAESQREYILARRLGLTLLAIGLMFGVSANLTA